MYKESDAQRRNPGAGGDNRVTFNYNNKLLFPCMQLAGLCVARENIFGQTSEKAISKNIPRSQTFVLVQR
jgi:hypothetical protein